MKWRVIMLRKVAIFVVTAGLTMSPLAVQALGFGGIKLKSSLNEKLNAEVILSSATADDIQSLSIKLASEEAFLRSGIDRTALLNKLKFNVKQRSNGDYYIHLTTSATVREPFMNFLLEMNWKNGRMLREYTMLIDPPSRAPRQAEPAPVVAETLAPEIELAPEVVDVEPEMESVVVEIEEPTPFVEPITLPEPVVEAEPEPEMVEDVIVAESPLESYLPEDEAMPVVEAEQEPVAEIVAEPEFISEPEVIIEPELLEPTAIDDIAVDDVAATEVFEEEASAEIWPAIPLAAFDTSEEEITHIEEAHEEMPVMDDMGIVENETGDLDYGIIKKNDNLWNIAEKLRNGNEDVSVYQVMMALLQNNPDAFTNNNVHRLKVGHVLRIDDESELTRLSRKEAASAFIEQTHAWDDYRQQAAGEASIQPIMAGDTDVEDQLSDTNASGELTLSSPDGESLTSGGGLNEESLSNDLATMQDQLRQAKADSGTTRTRNVALNNKLQSLEDELNRLQRSMSIKDDELAALQQQLSQLGNTTTAEMPAAEPMVEEALVETPVVEETPAEIPVTADVLEPSEPVTLDAPIEAKPNPVELAEKIANEEAAADSATSNSEASIMDTVMGVVASIGVTAAGLAAGLGGGMALYIGVPILLIILGIAIVVIKRRRQGDNFQESILTGTASTAAGEGTETQSGNATTFSEESSFLSDFAMSGASAIEADDSEVDPLTEADVFMAYGRYEAAEERLNEAVQSDPERMELRAKLLELYHATQNKASFESAAEDFYAGLGENEAESPLWAKVVEMGREVAPENPLFSQGDDSPTAVNYQGTNETAAIEDPGMAMTDSQVMDIGLETGVFAAAELSGSTDEIASDDLDFNLDLGDMGDLGTSTTEDATETATPETDEIAMDFNIGDDETEAAEPEPAADLDFNLDTQSDEVAEVDAGLDFNLDIEAETTTDDVAADLDVSSTEEAGLDFDLDMGSDDSESLDFNLDASDTADEDMGGSDEVGTKLDLAKAYIDMGDPEGARSILDEVMDEGSSTQKEEAQSLLGQIA